MAKISQRIFRNKKNLKSMIRLRKKGYTLKSLGFIFGVDYTSIYHHVKGVHTNGNVAFDLSSVLSTFQVDTSSILNLLNIQVRHYRTYSEYLEESRCRFPNIRKQLERI